MLQTNLIFGIQKKIKEGKRGKASMKNISVLEESNAGVITEADQETKEKKEILIENYYNPSIASGIYDQVRNSQKKTSTKKILMTESFHMAKIEKKLTKDISYFNYLFENFVEDVFKEDYGMLLENIFEDTIKLYQECDVTPRVISPAIDSNELNESQIVDLYKNSLNKNIKDNYTKPLLSGKISELYESEIKTLTKKLLEEGVTADIDQVRIYLPFEETLYRFNKEVIIPGTAQSRIEAYMESTTVEYNDLLEESAEEILKKIEQKIKLLTSMVSPNMFDKAVDAEGVNAPKMAGISITVDKNFNDEEEDCGEEGPCPAEVAAMDPEAAEELASDDEAEEIDSAGEDIVGAEEDAKDSLGQASDSEDLESLEAENRAELSPAEASGEEPGAIEKDLPLSDGTAGETGLVVNDGDVALQGNGNDSKADDFDGTGTATLPGSPVEGTTQDVASDSGFGDAEKESGGVEDTSEPTIDTDNDESLSKGTIGAADASVDKEEIIGADGDDSNASIGGIEVDSEEPETATETPTEDEMDSKDENGKIEEGLPMPRI